MCDGKLRLLRGRSMGVGEDMFKAYYHEFEQAVEAKLIRVQVGGAQGEEYPFTKAAAEPEVEEKQEEEVLAPPMDVGTPPPPPPPTPPTPVFEEKAEEPAPEAEEKPIDKMNKAELVAFLADASGLPEEELNAYTKRQLLEQAPELLAESAESD